jgi:hypothetical protein
MEDIGRKLVEEVHRKAIEAMGPCQRQLVEAPTIDCSELPASKPGDPDPEWDLYRREVGRLLDEGHEGRWVLIQGEQIIGIWNTREEAKAVALKKFLMQPCLIHQVRRREPIVRMSARFWGCQS